MSLVTVNGCSDPEVFYFDREYNVLLDSTISLGHNLRYVKSLVLALKQPCHTQLNISDRNSYVSGCSGVECNVGVSDSVQRHVMTSEAFHA
jgi:hypothetical protein